MRNLLGILAFALSVMPSAMFAQVSNNNEDGVYKTERHNHRSFRQGEVIVKFKTGSAMGNMARSSLRVSAVSSMSSVMSIPVSRMAMTGRLVVILGVFHRL